MCLQYHKNKIFVGGLAASITDSEFRSYFEQFGEISEAVVMMDRSTQRSRGFGFVTFKTDAPVSIVLRDKDSHELGGTSGVGLSDGAEGRSGGGRHQQDLFSKPSA